MDYKGCITKAQKKQMFCLATNGEYTRELKNLSSATQKDAKPMNDHMGEAFENRPGIPVSGKTGQRGSCSSSILCLVGTETVLRDTNTGDS